MLKGDFKSFKQTSRCVNMPETSLSAFVPLQLSLPKKDHEMRSKAPELLYFMKL